MEIQVIKDNYNYRYFKCPKCKSELKIRNNSIKDANKYKLTKYSKREYVNIICPCCNRGIMVLIKEDK